MRKRVVETIVQYGMVKKGDCVLVGLSGGADSTSLLHVLCSMREEWKITVSAAHLNHCLRGEESDRDEAFCRKLCEQIGVSLTVERADVAKAAKRSGESVEQCGRRLRYALFERESLKNGARIATAHTLSDSVETVLLHLTRGTGLKGLCGIPPVRGNIIRPLIECTRADVERYAADQGLSFVEDSSNRSRDYARNRVRLDVVPVLETLNPSLAQSVSRMMRQARQDEQCLAGLAEEALRKAARQDGYSVSELLNCPDAVLTRAVIEAGRRAGSGMMEHVGMHHGAS
ncbi:MAG: tRNA lysidine(34) synthetase TilS [Clostridiales bacterium]|nr:tRNA lysidine(34) synthetase TilS [Clostridiales bacterium]